MIGGTLEYRAIGPSRWLRDHAPKGVSIEQVDMFRMPDGFSYVWAISVTCEGKRKLEITSDKREDPEFPAQELLAKLELISP